MTLCKRHQDRERPDNCSACVEEELAIVKASMSSHLEEYRQCLGESDCTCEMLTKVLIEVTALLDKASLISLASRKFILSHPTYKKAVETADRCRSMLQSDDSS